MKQGGGLIRSGGKEATKKQHQRRCFLVDSSRGVLWLSWCTYTCEGVGHAAWELIVLCGGRVKNVKLPSYALAHGPGCLLSKRKCGCFGVFACPASTAGHFCVHLLHILPQFCAVLVTYNPALPPLQPPHSLTGTSQVRHPHTARLAAGGTGNVFTDCVMGPFCTFAERASQKDS